MRAEAVLAFGVLCATTATFLLAHVANVLTAALALGGFYTYVFIYTRWLKRSSPQNIVIGGAAGAFPPLVGWAAVTGRIDLLAIYLFLIIFYWTPPHFWALALNKQRDYGRAGVPMAPLVWGERETMRNMLWYTLILLPLTVLPVAFGALGIPYLVAAAAARRMAARRRDSRHARRRLREAGVVGVQVLAALPRAALRGDGRRSGDRVTRRTSDACVTAAPSAEHAARDAPAARAPVANAPETLLLIGAPDADERRARARLVGRRLERTAPRARGACRRAARSGSRSRARRDAR